MYDIGVPLPELLFTVIVFAAMLALFTEYGEIVIAATLLAAIWQLVDLLGASLWLATLLLVLAAMLRTVVLLLPRIELGTPLVVRLLDDLLSRHGRIDEGELNRRFGLSSRKRTQADETLTDGGRR